MAEVYGLHSGDDIIRYIGMTSRTGVQRFKEHLRASKAGKRFPIYDWMRKHGQAVQVVTIEICDNDIQAKELEKSLIAKIGRDHLLNCTDGGDGVTGWTYAARLKMSKIKSNPSLETRAKISASKKGQKFTQEHKEKLSLARTGLKPSAETRAKLSEAKKNQSPETRAKIAAAQKARHAAGVYRKEGI